MAERAVTPPIVAVAEADLPVLGCPGCGQVCLDAGTPRRGDLRCPRCWHVLRRPQPSSVQRTWAFVIASAILYVPANVLPVMSTTTRFETTQHTLLGGIHDLWVEGSWFLAVIVFIASIAVPMLKIGALGLLAWSVRHAPSWRRMDRSRLYRLIEVVGHWSMLDVYVVVLLAASVRFGPLARAEPEPGLLAFGAVVVLTLFAARSFDSRLIWREPASSHG